MAQESWEEMREEALIYESQVNRGNLSQIEGHFDYSGPQSCCVCVKAIEGKVSLCSGCQANVYCSRDCQVKDWKSGNRFWKTPHKQDCKSFQEHMKDGPVFQQSLSIFPWKKVESDGTFNDPFCAARFGLLDEDFRKVGLWAMNGGFITSDDESDPYHISKYQETLQASGIDPLKHAMFGAILLGSKKLTDMELWRLPANLIPRLEFGDRYPPPRRLEGNDIVDWKTWHEWRSVPFQSPVSLVLHYPLSIYRILVNVLKVVDLSAKPKERRKLRVHLLGAECELNVLPCFGELALLLPDTDIEMVLFGPVVRALTMMAARHHPSSPAAQPVAYEYTAPGESGGGSITVSLDGEQPYYTRASPGTSSDQWPNAIIGLNAGLIAYPQWPEVVATAFILDIPFATTEITRRFAERAKGEFQKILVASLRQYKDVIGEQTAIACAQKQREHPIATNPFHKPGRRSVKGESRLPFTDNAFTIAVNSVS